MHPTRHRSCRPQRLLKKYFTNRNLIRSSCPANLPSNFFDAHFLIGLFIIVEPLAISQLDAGKLGSRIDTFREPLALKNPISFPTFFFYSVCG